MILFFKPLANDIFENGLLICLKQQTLYFYPENYFVLLQNQFNNNKRISLKNRCYLSS
jgi:hypothetical protein